MFFKGKIVKNLRNMVVGYFKKKVYNYEKILFYIKLCLFFKIYNIFLKSFLIMEDYKMFEKL